jgi:hypothetical protein
VFFIESSKFAYVSDAFLDFHAYILACFMIRPMFAEKTEPQHYSDFIDYQYFQIARVKVIVQAQEITN